MNVNILEIKSIHLPFFDDMLQVEMFVLEKLGAIRQGCIDLTCVSRFDSQHIPETHPMCIWARCFKLAKLPNRFENRGRFIEHAKSHQFRTEKVMECSLCLQDYVDTLSLGNILGR